MITLIPVNPSDPDLMAIMTRETSPRWMRIAACIALEGRRLVLPKKQHPVMDACDDCNADGLCWIHAFHKNGDGSDVRCLIECGACGRIKESRSFDDLASREGNPLKGLAEAF